MTTLDKAIDNVVSRKVDGMTLTLTEFAGAGGKIDIEMQTIVDGELIMHFTSEAYFMYVSDAVEAYDHIETKSDALWILSR